MVRSQVSPVVEALTYQPAESCAGVHHIADEPIHRMNRAPDREGKKSEAERRHRAGLRTVTLLMQMCTAFPSGQAIPGRGILGPVPAPPAMARPLPLRKDATLALSPTRQGYRR